MSETGRPAYPVRAPVADERGFTLIETMVALAILALVTSVCFPAIARVIDRHAMVEARGTIALTLARARAVAIAQGVPVRVTLASDAAQGTSLVASGGLPPAALPAGVTAEWPSEGFTLMPDGSASGDHAAFRAGGVVGGVTVEQATGRVRFEP